MEKRPLDSDFPQRDLSALERLASLGELIGGIAHELNNPLTAILGYSEILQTIDFDPNVKRYISNIHVAALRSVKIVEGLLTFLRKKEIAFDSVNLNDVIMQTLPLFEYQMKKNDIALTLNLGTGLSPLHGNFYKLQQVFFNLIMNTLQALENWGGRRSMSITTYSTIKTVTAIVLDSGPGINPEHVDRIFAPFFTTKPKGTGLGLSIVYGIVHEHGGTIFAQPRPEGCSFVIELPAAGESLTVLDYSNQLSTPLREGVGRADSEKS